MTSKLFSDLDLGGPDDLRSDLRGHQRPQFKNRFFTHLEGRTLISTINQRLFEAIEAMEAVEVMEAVEAMEAIEAAEVVKTTVTEAVWAMEA